MALGLRLATLLVAAVAVAWAGTLSDPFLIRAKVASAELAAPDALASAAGDVDAPTSSSSEPRAPTVLPPALAVESRAARHAEMLEEFHAEDVWKNDLMLFFVPADVRARIPHYVQVRAGRRAPWDAPWAGTRRGERGGGRTDMGTGPEVGEN